MKKFILTLAIAVLSTCAQAVTIDWQTGNVGTSTNSNPDGVTVGGSYTIFTQVTPSAVNDWMYAVGVGMGSGNQYAIGVNEQGQWHLYKEKGDAPKVQEIQNIVTATIGQTSTLALTFDSSTKTLYAYVDGKLVGSLIVANDANLQMYYTIGEKQNGNSPIAGDYQWDVINEYLTAEEIAGAVPEPTALALLLMGVAAVGLRRKARTA